MYGLSSTRHLRQIAHKTRFGNSNASIGGITTLCSPFSTSIVLRSDPKPQYKPPKAFKIESSNTLEKTKTVVIPQQNRPEENKTEAKVNVQQQKETREADRGNRSQESNATRLVYDRNEDLNFKRHPTYTGSLVVEKPNTHDKAFNYAVTRVKTNGREIYVLGTVQGAQQSLEHAQRLLDKVNFNVVSVELDPRHAYLYDFRTIQNDEYESLVDLQQSRTKITSAYVQKKNPLLAAIHASTFFSCSADRFCSPQVVKIAELAGKFGKNVILADRPAEITIQRLWNLNTLMDKAKMVYKLYQNVNYEAEHMPAIPLVEVDFSPICEVDSQLQGVLMKNPAAQMTLLFERALFAAEKVRQSKGEKVLVVASLGIVHDMIHAFGLPNIHIEKLKTADEGVEESVEAWERIRGTAQQHQENK